MEFFFWKAPSSMQSFATSLTWASLATDYYLSSSIISVVNSTTSSSNDASQLSRYSKFSILCKSIQLQIIELVVQGVEKFRCIFLRLAGVHIVYLSFQPTILIKKSWSSYCLIIHEFVNLYNWWLGECHINLLAQILSRLNFSALPALDRYKCKIRWWKSLCTPLGWISYHYWVHGSMRITTSTN